jgi:uncharacterized protein YwgA
VVPTCPFKRREIGVRASRGKVNGSNLSLFKSSRWNKRQKEVQQRISCRTGLGAEIPSRRIIGLSQRSELFSLGGILKRIGNFDPNRFESDFGQRLLTQKTVYLLQSFGLYLGYLFTWYIRGPYSPSLTRDAYDLVQIYPHIPEVKFTDSQAESRFVEFQKFLRTLDNDAKLCEILASVHFLRHLNIAATEDELFKELRSRKAVSHDLYNRAVDLLKQHALF